MMSFLWRFLSRDDGACQTENLVDAGSVAAVPPPAPHENLRVAARLVENAAFDLAGDHPSPLISQLILISADLERLSARVEHGDDAVGARVGA
jgi:hypothetical protein